MAKQKRRKLTNKELLLLGTGLVLGIFLISLIYILQGNEAPQRLNTTIVSPSPSTITLKKKVYYGNIPADPGVADKVVQDTQSGDNEIYYWKKISVPELVVPGEGASSIEQQKVPSIYVYAENGVDRPTPDSIVPVDDVAYDTGVVWVRYGTKHESGITSYEVGHYKIVVVY